MIIVINFTYQYLKYVQITYNIYPTYMKLMLLKYSKSFLEFTYDIVFIFSQQEQNKKPSVPFSTCSIQIMFAVRYHFLVLIHCSQLRQIPDNQEVYTHSQTDQSIIVEILEYVEQSDEEAIK